MNEMTTKKSPLVAWLIVVIIVVLILLGSQLYSRFIKSTVQQSTSGTTGVTRLIGNIKTSVLTPGQHTIKLRGKTASGQTKQSVVTFTVVAAASPSPSLTPSVSVSPSPSSNASPTPSSPPGQY